MFGSVSVTNCWAATVVGPDQVAPPVFDGTREGGFGVYLIRQLVDEVHYTRDSAGLCAIHLVKKRNPIPPQEHHACN